MRKTFTLLLTAAFGALAALVVGPAPSRPLDAPSGSVRARVPVELRAWVEAPAVDAGSATVEVRIRATPPSPAERLVIVVDRSGSMAEDGAQALEAARAAAQLAFDTRHYGDELTLISSASDVSIDYDHGPGTRRAWGRFRQAVLDLLAGGGTNLGAGLSTALDLIQRRGDDRPRRVLLITDGRRHDARDPVLEHAFARAREQEVRVDVLRVGPDAEAALDPTGFWADHAESTPGGSVIGSGELLDALRERELHTGHVCFFPASGVRVVGGDASSVDGSCQRWDLQHAAREGSLKLDLEARRPVEALGHVQVCYGGEQTEPLALSVPVRAPHDLWGRVFHSIERLRRRAFEGSPS